MTETIAEEQATFNYWLKKDLESALEDMPRRFRRVERQSLGFPPGRATRRLETLPPDKITSLSLEEQAGAI